MKVAQSCPALCHPMDYTVHGILQVRILEWVAFPFSRGSTQLRFPALKEDSLPVELPGKQRIIALQCRVGFCNTSTWVSHRYTYIQGFLSSSVVKNLPAKQEMQETQVPSLGQEDPREEGVATHSSTAWEILLTEKPGGLQSMGLQKCRTLLHK